MSFDLSWLWNLLNSIASTIQSWFSGIWSQVQNIVNTGQGIFSGLVAFGSQIWDALIKFAQAFGEWIASGLNWVKQGLENAFNTLGAWLNNAYTFIAQGVSWIGNQFYNIGNWIYNALYTLWNWAVNTITGIYNALVSWFSGVATAIGTWWSSTISGLNTWFSNLILGFRTKIVTTITADLTIAGAWKGAERIMSPKSMEDIGYGLLGIIASPIVGRLVGAIVDAVVPLPTSTTYPLIPSIGGFSYTPPSLTVTTPTEKAPPTPIVAGAPTGPFTGVSEKDLKASGESYEVNVSGGQDLLRKSFSYDYTVEIT